MWQGWLHKKEHRGCTSWRFSDESLIERQHSMILILKRNVILKELLIFYSTQLDTWETLHEWHETGFLPQDMWEKNILVYTKLQWFLIHLVWQRYNKMLKDCLSHSYPCWLILIFHTRLSSEALQHLYKLITVHIYTVYVDLKCTFSSASGCLFVQL